MKFNYLSILFVLFCFATNLAVAGDPEEDFVPRTVSLAEANTKINKAALVLDEMTESADQGIPLSLLRKAHAIAVIPDLVEAGLVIAAKLGRGIVVIRNDDGSWSNPVFITTGGGSFGFQAGAQSADIILVFQSREGVEKMLNTQFTLSAKAGVAAGPIGRSAEAGTDLEFKSPIYSYSRTSGLFAGVSLEGSIIEVDRAANEGLYGENINPKDVFKEKVSTDSRAVSRLKEVLAKYAAPKK